MDYLLVGIASILFPYILNLSGIDYQAYVGLKGSFQDFNKYDLEVIDKSNSYVVTQQALINSTGYGIRPDFFIDYAMNKGRFWFAPTFGVEPLDTGIQFKTRVSTGTSTNANEIHYIKGAYMGLKLGFSVLKPYPELNGYGAFGITPYILGGIKPIAYEGASNYQSSLNKRYEPFYGIGAKIDFKGPWSAYMQYQYFEFETKGSALSRQVNIKESEFQFGVAYWFRNSEEKSKLEKIDNYKKVVKEINYEEKEDSKKGKSFLPFFLSPKGETIKDGAASPSRDNTERSKNISNNNKELKEDSKLVDKVKKKKKESLINLNAGSVLDF